MEEMGEHITGHVSSHIKYPKINIANAVGATVATRVTDATAEKNADVTAGTANRHIPINEYQNYYIAKNVRVAHYRYTLELILFLMLVESF